MIKILNYERAKTLDEFLKEKFRSMPRTMVNGCFIQKILNDSQGKGNY